VALYCNTLKYQLAMLSDTNCSTAILKIRYAGSLLNALAAIY